MCFGTRSLKYGDERRYALSVLNTILSGGMSTRLFQNIREKYGYVYSIFSFAEFMSDTGYFCIYAGTDASKTDKVIDLVKSEMDLLVTEPVTDEELLSAKAQWKGGALISMESMMSRMNRQAMREMYFGTYSDIDELIRKIDAVRKEDIIEVANTIYSDGYSVVSVIKPDSDSE